MAPPTTPCTTITTPALIGILRTGEPSHPTDENAVNAMLTEMTRAAYEHVAEAVRLVTLVKMATVDIEEHIQVHGSAAVWPYVRPKEVIEDVKNIAPCCSDCVFAVTNDYVSHMTDRKKKRERPISVSEGTPKKAKKQRKSKRAANGRTRM